MTTSEFLNFRPLRIEAVLFRSGLNMHKARRQKYQSTGVGSGFFGKPEADMTA